MLFFKNVCCLILSELKLERCKVTSEQFASALLDSTQVGFFPIAIEYNGPPIFMVQDFPFLPPQTNQWPAVTLSASLLGTPAE